MTRRELLKTIVLGVQTIMTLPPGLAEARSVLENHLSGRLSFHHKNTGESLIVHYLDKSGKLDPAACAELNRFFRCRYTNETAGIDPGLFVLLDSVQTQLKAQDRPFLLYSGFRSGRYNRSLRRRDRDVARDSYHLKGMAADISLDGVPLREIKRVAKSLRAGGTGRYGDFVHLDVGPVRCW